MNRNILFIIILFLSLGLFYYFNYFQSTEKVKISINDYVFETEVAQTEKGWVTGLSDRDFIEDNQAMLFLLPEKRIYSFWMKDMRFDIDLLWIDGNQIVAYEKNMKAFAGGTEDIDFPVYDSPQAIDKVLEIRAGLIDELKIEIGDTISINRKELIKIYD